MLKMSHFIRQFKRLDINLVVRNDLFPFLNGDSNLSRKVLVLEGPTNFIPITAKG